LSGNRRASGKDRSCDGNEEPTGATGQTRT
jgi:hypothetical protein